MRIIFLVWGGDESKKPKIMKIAPPVLGYKCTNTTLFYTFEIPPPPTVFWIISFLTALQMRLGRLPRRDRRQVAAYNEASSERAAGQTERRQRHGTAGARRPPAQSRQVQQEARTAEHRRLRTQEHDHSQVPTAPQQTMAGAANEAVDAQRAEHGERPPLLLI